MCQKHFLSQDITPDAPKPEGISPDGFLTAAQAASWIGISLSTLYKLTSQRKLPHYKPGNKLLLFKRRELDNWIEAGRVLSVCELNALAMDHLRTLSQTEGENKKSHGANVANVKSLPGTRRY